MSASERIPEEIAALISAHALGALEPEEAEQVDRWIAGSDDCRRLFEEALEAASWLAMATTDAEPPPELRARILAALRDQREP
jgi:anti-sigma-K factor RskA